MPFTWVSTRHSIIPADRVEQVSKGNNNFSKRQNRFEVCSVACRGVRTIHRGGIGTTNQIFDVLKTLKPSSSLEQNLISDTRSASGAPECLERNA